MLETHFGPAASCGGMTRRPSAPGQTRSARPRSGARPAARGKARGPEPGGAVRRAPLRISRRRRETLRFGAGRQTAGGRARL